MTDLKQFKMKKFISHFLFFVQGQTNLTYLMRKRKFVMIHKFNRNSGCWYQENYNPILQLSRSPSTVMEGDNHHGVSKTNSNIDLICPSYTAVIGGCADILTFNSECYRWHNVYICWLDRWFVYRESKKILCRV